MTILPDGTLRLPRDRHGKRWPRFSRCLLALSTRVRPGLPVRVEFKRLDKGYFGHANVDRRGYLIELSSKMTEDEAVDTLIHEWAHCLAWPRSGRAQHGRPWGIAFARCFRAYEA